MKARICDVCGKQISDVSLWERYVFWMSDSVFYKDWPKRLDICHECMDKIKEIINGTDRQEKAEGIADARASEMDVVEGPADAAHKRRVSTRSRRTRQPADSEGNTD